MRSNTKIKANALTKQKSRKPVSRSVKSAKTSRSPAKSSRTRVTRSRTKKKSLLVRLGLKTEYEYKKLHIGIALIFLAGMLAGVILGVNHLIKAASGNPYVCANEPVLTVGSTDKVCVQRVQWYLANKANALALVNRIDGNYDATTKTNVTNFQAWTGLVASGNVDAATWKGLDLFEGGVAPTLKPGLVQGYRNPQDHADLFNNAGTVTFDGTIHKENPYFITPNGVGYGRHFMSAEAPAGWKVVGYSLCINATPIGCHDAKNVVAGSSAWVDVPSGGYVDIWWNYTYAPTAAATAPVAAPGFTVSNNIKNHTCLVPGSSTTKPCTLDEYNQQTAFLKAVIASTTCVGTDLKPYTCTASDHDKQAAFFTSLTTCIKPTPTNPLATSTCSVADHQKQADYLQAITNAQAAARAEAAKAAAVSNWRGGNPDKIASPITPLCDETCAADYFNAAAFAGNGGFTSTASPSCDETCAADHFNAAAFAASGGFTNSNGPITNNRNYPNVY
jgi:peptidoglycan hydrolase-like protein with peptidoglycan-binding domain